MVKERNKIWVSLNTINYSRFFTNVMGFPMCITETQKCVPIGLPAAKPYLLVNLQEDLRKLHHEHSFLGTTGEQGRLCIELHIYCSNVDPGPAPQTVVGEESK